MVLPRTIGDGSSLRTTLAGDPQVSNLRPGQLTYSSLQMGNRFGLDRWDLFPISNSDVSGYLTGHVASQRVHYRNVSVPKRNASVD